MTEHTSKLGWTRVKFGDVVQLNTERVSDPLAAGIDRYVGLEHLTPDDLHIRSWGNVADGTTFTNLFKPGQVLFGKRRAYQRKIAVAEFEGVCSGDIYLFETKDPNVLLPELLPFICQTEGFYQHAVGTSAGSLSPRTNWTQLAGYKFPLPPLDEQRRIADILLKMDGAIIEYQRLITYIERLLGSWQASFFGHSSYQTIKLGKLLDNKMIGFKTGPFGTVLKASSYKNHGIPVINPVNMVNGGFDVANGPFINESEAKRLVEYKILKNDLVFARKGDIGRGVIASSEHEEFILGSDCIRIRVIDSSIAPKYLYYFLTSPLSRRLLSAQAHGTTMPGINEKMLSRMNVYLPEISRQTEIVKEIDLIVSAKDSIRLKINETFKMKQIYINNLLKS